jgi:hypothetical protein
MAAPTLENIQCIFWLRGCVECSKDKPYQNGSPCCCFHLRLIFGLDAIMTSAKISCHNEATFYGPFLIPAPGVQFLPGVVILPNRKGIDAVIKNTVDKSRINPHLVQYINNLQENNGKNNNRLRVILETLRNCFEDDTEISIADETLKAHIDDAKQDFKKAIKQAVVYERVADRIKIPSAGDEVTPIKLSTFPLMFQFTGVHIPVSVCMIGEIAGVNYLPLATLSNVTLADLGYESLKVIGHTEPLIQAGEAQGNVYEEDFFKHKRPVSGVDKSLNTIEYNSGRLQRIYRKPPSTCETVLKTMSTDLRTLCG